MSKNSVVIVNGARTPMGGLQGKLGAVPAPELGAIATRAALERAGVAPDQIEELLYGCVLPAGLGQAPARQVALRSDMALSTQCTTVNKVCGSGMKTVLMAHDQILAGTCQTAVAGGMESMTRAPYFIPGAREGLRAGHKEIKDHMFFDALEDAFTGTAMGSYAQDIADNNNVTREAMDEYALESLSRARDAIEKGYFEKEIVPVTVKTRSGEEVVSVDEQPCNAKPEKIPNLKPAFKKDGTITAANSSSISDGAASLVLTAESFANKNNLQPMARIVAHTSNAIEPKNFPVAPVGSMEKLLQKTGWQASDVDLFEVNEAFAVVAMLAMNKFDVPRGKFNCQGGACALGHPVGASGARIIVTLMYALQRLGKQKGIASICIGGGEATSIAIEML
jgi:acetyl-CoA C-acetyltransferase